MSKTSMIDGNSLRGGAGVSVVVLLAGYLGQWRGVVPAMAAILAIGSLFGVRRSPLGYAWRGIKQTLRLSIAPKPEEAGPPRFAQTVGFVFLALASVGFYALDSNAIGWGLALMVAALQALLAVTGICVGCEMYLLARRVGARGAAGGARRA